MNADEPILRFTQEAYDRLSLLATRDPEVYLNSETNFDEVLNAEGINRYAETDRHYRQSANLPLPGKVQQP